MDPSKSASGGSASPGRPFGNPSTLGGFQIIEKVGQGGMGAVFRARQLSMDRVVALKILPQKIAQDQKAKERFLREARICAGLNHANLINGIDCGEAGGYMYFAMEFVEGETVKTLLKRKGRLQTGECLKIVRQIAAALEYAHSKKLIHRDVKPDNIMLAPDGTAKLCDLGLARSTSAADDSSLTQAGQSVGTPYYISPEQARGEETDPRTDIYALGATIYHLLAGQPVFDGGTGASVMARHITDCGPALSAANPGISDEIAAIVSKMMAKNPADRYATVGQFVADLDAVEECRTPAAAQFRGASSCARPPGAKRKPGATRQVNPAKPREADLKTTRPGAPKKSAPVGLWIGMGLAALVIVAALALGLGSGKEKEKRVSAETSKAAPVLPVVPSVPVPPPPAVATGTGTGTATAKADVSEPAAKPVSAPIPIPAVIPAPAPKDPPPVAPIPPPTPALPAIEKPEVAVSNGPIKAEVQLARARFLTEILRRTAKQELTKIRKDASELATHAEFAAAKELIAEDLKDLDKAIAFEQSALESIAERKLTIPLPAGHPLRALGAEKVKVEQYEAHGLMVTCAEVQTRLAASSLPAVTIVELGALKRRDADVVNYLMARGAIADARKLLPSLTDAERERLQTRLDLAKTGETELAAQVAYEELCKLAQGKQWKPLLEKAAAFEANYTATAVAKDKGEEIATFKAQADENLNPVSKFFHAKVSKQLADGAIELAYDFSDPAQLADFACEHGALSASKGRLIVPSGGGEWSQARFLPPVAEIVRLEVTGRTQCGANRFGVYILAPKNTDGTKAPRCMCRVYDHHLHLELWGSPDIIGSYTADWNKDTTFLAELQPDGQLKWTVDGTEVGKVKVPASAAGGNIALISVDGDHSWTNFKVTLKPDTTWLNELRTRLPKP